MTEPIPYWKDLTVKERMNKERRWNKIADTVNTALGLVPTRNISINVQSEGIPVPSATVTIEENSKNTGKAGGCSFNNLTDGQKTVVIQAEGYQELTENITVDADNTSFTFNLTSI